MSDAAQPDDEVPNAVEGDQRLSSDIQDPPSSVSGILRQIGPGLIIAANIVGSGELIMTTKTGASAGIVLLWLILLGCIIKVFVQLELGRFTVSSGETTLTALNRVPGPRTKRINWVVLLWSIMALATIGQLGGIVGGVSQAVAITFPITGDYQDTMRSPASRSIVRYVEIQQQNPASEELSWVREELDQLSSEKKEDLLRQAQLVVNAADEQEQNEQLNVLTGMTSPSTWDDRIWAVIIGLFTSVTLYVGRYRMIENFSVVLVVSFTFLTIGNVIALQGTDYALETSDIIRGLSFGLPEGSDAIMTALATFGIIGVGASELVMYPYWCLEKGYAKSVGPKDDSGAWLSRAKGWVRVMKYDAFASMVIYTLSTAAFFLMGVAVLHKDGRNPGNSRLVATLAESYVPVFGDYGRLLLLIGAIAVLYSTYMVANASNSRVFADFTGVIGLSDRNVDSKQRRFLVSLLSFCLPLVCVVVYLVVKAPLLLIMISGTCQSLLLPVLGYGALYFRYRETDIRLRPSRLWDLALITSCIGMLVIGSYGIYKEVLKLG
ncbi:MAG: Nramp family divalent metal transporter [Fuerstiella sp.]|nr:Nramp family divalent metal transporter [Fuerstiella sp.]